MNFKIRRRPDTLFIDPYPEGYTVTWSVETLINGHPTPTITPNPTDASAEFSIPVFDEDAPYLITAEVCEP